MTHKMSKKYLSLVSIIILFMVSFTILGGTERSFENIKKGVISLFSKNDNGEPIREKVLLENNDGTYNVPFKTPFPRWPILYLTSFVTSVATMA